MSSRIRLVHLTVVGQGVIPASIEFGDRLTVVHGVSDTGKSHVFDLIQYVFGLASKIEMPDEGKGYQYIHLGLMIKDGIPVTLIRDVNGGQVGLVEADVRILLDHPAPEYLVPKHVSKDPRSLSRYLLSLADLDGQFVRKNQYNETRLLEWRDVLRLSAVNEENILAKRSPIESGQHTDRSVEASIFRLLIEGRDDSGLTLIPKVEELKKISANKLEVLDSVITNLELELADAPPVDQLSDQLTRVKESLETSGRALNDVSARRNQVVRQRSLNADLLASFRERWDELSSLGSRFRLLLAQYDSDLSRLEMLAQADDVLSGSEDGMCPFCGADASHQHWPAVLLDDSELPKYGAAIRAEQAKIKSLRTSLEDTIQSIRLERISIRERFESIRAEDAQLATVVFRLDADLALPNVELAPMMDMRSRLERQIDAHNRLLSFLALRMSIAQINRPKATSQVPITSSDLNEFDEVATAILQQWSFPKDSSVRYSVGERDLVVDQRLRRVRGKGVRSVLHALFNVALADYCLRRGYRHPGFVILDSPIVTYRQPEDPVLAGEDETVNTSVVDAFYTYLQNSFTGQSLILENKSPVSPLPVGSREYFFSGDDSSAIRGGFYPRR